MPQILKITPAQLEALTTTSRQAFIARMMGWLANDPRTAARTGGLGESWGLDALAAANQAGVTEEVDVLEFAVLRLVAPSDRWRSPEAQEIVTSSRPGALKVFQLRHVFGNDGRRG